MSSMIPRATRSALDPTASSETATDPFDGEVTLYLRTGVSDVVRDRQRTVLARLDQLAAEGAIESVRTVQWAAKARVPADGPTPEAAARYDEFADAVGAGALRPFFKERPGVGRLERVVVLPAVCLAVRNDEEVLGVCPRYDDGNHESVEDGVAALADGRVL
ncbi:uncharacterized protein Nmlp_2059 [Natronomonas moolapensis 8.8.11]|uniref:Uncharacterized protein n=1 Tax=Natronomonas moolapensis (strain DSM 18674 / CECT 7526 / JCM 14361 / 8.8.11) TaxID=268739 RepID=M1XKN9_NATM8|nr:HTH domain-containing protein [Natronomonas moolapensis]CCQ36242.1 uncharacterized protein Nmlp_2059 [Natronomonas moolapensis 8.8.11]